MAKCDRLVESNLLSQLEKKIYHNQPSGESFGTELALRLKGSSVFGGKKLKGKIDGYGMVIRQPGHQI